MGDEIVCAVASRTGFLGVWLLTITAGIAVGFTLRALLDLTIVRRPLVPELEPYAPCVIRIAGDSTWCELCGLRWDTNESDPPGCEYRRSAHCRS